jgi:hypothetical protein
MQMSLPNRSLGLAALGWWLAARGLSEPIEESFFRLEPAGVQRLGKASRLAALVATRRLARALRDEPASAAGQTELFSSETSPTTWLDRLDVVLNAPRVGLRLEKALTGVADDFGGLLEIELAEDRAVMLAARLAEWLQSQVGGDDEPAALASFLAQGWPLAPGADRHITFLQEFLINLHAELADAPAEITLPLGEPEEFRAWLETEAARPSAPVTATRTLDLPEPTPPITPAPPLAATESSAVHAEPEPAAVPAVDLSEPLRERTRLRVWAFLFQVGWAALLIVGWRALQHHRVAIPTPVSLTPAVLHTSPTPAFRSEKIMPPVAQPPTPTPVPTVPPSPRPVLKPELSIMPNDLHSQALALAAEGHHAEAVPLFRRISQIQAQDRTIGRLPRALVLARLASSLAALERWDEADAVVERAQALLEELLPAQDAETGLGLEMVADYWASRERWPLAARLYQKAVQAYENTPAENSQEQIAALSRQAGALRQIGELNRAEQLYRQVVKAYSGAGAIVALDAASASHNLASILIVTERAAEARTYYEQALAWLAKAPPAEGQVQRMTALVSANYERCLEASGVPADEAQKKARKLLAPAVP